MTTFDLDKWQYPPRPNGERPTLSRTPVTEATLYRARQIGCAVELIYEGEVYVGWKFVLWSKQRG